MHQLPCQTILLTAAIVCGLGPHPSCADEHFPGLDDYVERARTQWRVPGVGVAIVEKGKIVVVRGYGVRRSGRESPVTPETPFAIASCTKSFTATAMGTLVDEGLVQWDDPVRKHVPNLELHDPWITRQVTIRDLLAHRTGLELSDLLWSKNEFDRDQILKRMRHVRPKHGFRTRMTYNNLTYLVAGRVIEKAAGRPWSDVVDERILRPLGMRSTTASPPGDDVKVAWPHIEVDGSVVPMEMEPNFAATIAPAGAIWSSTRDMALWLQWNVAETTERPVRTETRDELHAAQIVVPGRGADSTIYPHRNLRAAGLGWFVEDYRGRRLVWHGGSRNGFIAWIAMLPDERSGVVVLANVHRTGLNYALHHRILDALLGEPPKDWSTIVHDDYTEGWMKELRESRVEHRRKRERNTHPSRALDRFAGTYRHELYGDLVVDVAESGGLEMRFGPRRTATLEHWENDTFEADFPNPAVEDWHVTFAIGEDDEVESVHAVAAPWAPDWYDDGADVGRFHRVR